jgi:hypothetical protein
MIMRGTGDIHALIAVSVRACRMRFGRHGRDFIEILKPLPSRPNATATRRGEILGGAHGGEVPGPTAIKAIDRSKKEATS